MSNLKITSSPDETVITVEFGEPPANILSAALIGNLRNFLCEAQTNPNTKLIVFQGAGKHFSFGASVEEHQSDFVSDMLPVFHGLIGDLINCKIPTLAKVSGQCLGGGFEFALACNFIFASANSKFAVPEIQLGVFPPAACVILPFRSNDKVSNEMILTGETYTADMGLNAGFINKIFPPESLDEEVDIYINKIITPKSASSLSFANKAARITLSDTWSKTIERLEKLYLKELMSSEDANEGISSFIEKRKPNWKNR